MVLKHNRKNDLFEGILIQLAITVAKNNYTLPQNLQEQQHHNNKSPKRFVKASKTSRFRIGMFRTTQPFACGLEEVIAEEAVIIHENINYSNQKLNSEIID